RPGSRVVVRAEAAAEAQDAVPAGDSRVRADFIRVRGALGERMADLERAQDDFQEVTLTAFERRHCRAQRRDQGTVDYPAFLDAEDIHTQIAFQKLLVTFDDAGLPEQ